MSNPIFKQGSIFGPNQPAPSSFTPASKPVAKAGSIFGNNSAGANPRQPKKSGGKKNASKKPNKEVMQTPQNQPGSIFGSQSSISPQKSKQSTPKRGSFMSSEGSNPRTSHNSNKSQVAGEPKPSPFNSIASQDNSNPRKLMSRMRSAVDNQMGDGSSIDIQAFPMASFSPTRGFSRGRGDRGRGERGRGERGRGDRGRGNMEWTRGTDRGRGADRSKMEWVKGDDTARSDRGRGERGRGERGRGDRGRGDRGRGERGSSRGSRGMSRGRSAGSSQEEYQRHDKINRPCRFFASGTCKNGDNCNFLHVLEGETQNKGHMVWVNTKSMSSKRSQNDRPEDEMDEQDEVDQQEDEESEVEELDLIKPSNPPKVDNPNKGKDLRAMLDRMRQNKPKEPEVSKESSGNESGSEDQAYNSDTFGEVRKPKFTGKLKKITDQVPSDVNISQDSIEEVPQMEDQLSEDNAISEQEKEEEVGKGESISMPSNLIKISDEKPYEKIQKIIKEAITNRNQGVTPKLETAQSKLLKMCDEAEADKRMMSRDLSIFEMDPEYTDLSRIDRDRPPQAKYEWAVKIFKRSAADVRLDDPLTIRPIPLITLVMDYLLDEIADVDRKSQTKFMKPHGAARHSFAEIFVFIFDRTRAIRQELIILNQATTKDHIQLLEKISRFH